MEKYKYRVRKVNVSKGDMSIKIELTARVKLPKYPISLVTKPKDIVKQRDTLY